MSISSRIQEIETHIGDVYDTINYSYDTTGVNKNIINIPKYLKKGYIDIINNGIDTLYNNFPKVSGIGSNLSLTPTYEAPMKLNEIQGDTLQDGTPTPDTPVEIQSVTGLQNIEVYGKNLCNNALFVASSGATINSYTDNSISVTFVGTYKAATQFIDISNSIYTFSIGNISNNKGRMEVYLYNNGEQVGTKQNVTANQTYTIDNTSRLGDQIRLTLSNSDLTQTNEITFNNIQLEKGTQSTSFSPYFTPIELNKINTYQDSIKKSTGKNLLNSSQESYTLSANENYSQAIGEIYLEANTKYYISYDVNNDSTSNTRSTMYLQIGTGTRIYQDSGTNKNLTKGRKVWEYTPTQSAIYNVGYWLHTSNVEVTISNYMVSKSSDTSYEPYGKVWYIEKNIGKVVLDGSETQWARWFSTPGVYSCSNLIQTISSNETINCISNYYSNTYNRAYVRNHLDTIDNNIVTTGGELIIANKNYTALSDFKTWLSTHNTTVYTILATPEYTEITNTELIEDLESIELLKGENNITITSENLPALLQLFYYKQTLQGNVEYLDEIKANKEDIPSLDNYYTKQEVNNLIPDELSDLRDDSTHRLVSDSEKSTWNNKIDSSALTDYVKNTDYATDSVGGVIKTRDNLATGMDNGALRCKTKTYNEYNSLLDTAFIGKGTLENVIIGKGLIDNSVNNLTNYTKTSDLSSVATSGSYNDLSNKPTIPTIPTNVSTFTNDAGYITNSVNNLTNYTTTTDMNTALGNKQNTILSGTSDPDSSLGEDGDIYIQYES
jgi:hypothetical protein